MMRFILAVTLLFLGFTCICFSQTVSKSEKDSKKEAERLWELAIEAKGGREKLYKIDNIQLSRRGGWRDEFLIVYPNKTWEWEDYRPSVLGLTMTMLNLESGKKYWAHQFAKEVEIKPFAADDPIYSKSFSASIWITLDNKWLHPIPESMTSDRIGFEKVDIVQTRLNGQRIDFALNKKMHLPVKASFFLYDDNRKGEFVAWSIKLSNYFDYKGIKVPGKLDGNKAAYQFNVEYNPDIFITAPLPVETAADAWKVKK